MTRAEVQAGNYAAAHFSPAQGRVLYHMERLFRSTGGGIKAHAEWLRMIELAGLPHLVTRWNDYQCIEGLQWIERACRHTGLHHFRPCDTGWQDIAARVPHPDCARIGHDQDSVR